MVLAWFLPRPLDAIAAPPLVLLDIWLGQSADDAYARVSALVLGIVLTWGCYVLLARLVLWRVTGGASHRE